MAAEKKHGALWKVTEIGLGVASVAAIVMSFIPGVNLIGAAVQGGITLVQTGMALAEGNKKKAALTFGIGTLLTVASLVPYLGAVGNAGKVAVLGADGIKAVEAGSEAVGVAANTSKAVSGLASTGEAVGTAAKGTEAGAESAGFFGKIFKPIGDFFKTIGRAIRDLLYKIPGVEKAVNFISGNTAKYVKAPLVNAEGKTVAWGARNATVAKAGRAIAASPKLEKGLVWGANAGGIGLSFVNDTPPGNLANPDTYDFSNDNAEGSRQWRNRIEAERERAALATPDHQ